MHCRKHSLNGKVWKGNPVICYILSVLCLTASPPSFYCPNEQAVGACFCYLTNFISNASGQSIRDILYTINGRAAGWGNKLMTLRGADREQQQIKSTLFS